MDDEIVLRIAESLGIGQSEAQRVVSDVVDYYREPLDVWIRRRHRECKRERMRNPQIYELLQQEAAERVVAAPILSERQIRRIISG
ncbi:hypothetical protein KIH74_17690 [Kineosporia sp. J2-2]|uniref:Mor transcription activator domain-containing protein n=1 Tax=Kineosporia corallincola TaxID=2835133 RepID=A0ABS5TI76_9ACTN|nr:hypothetical protein [Kineosporia corallincola]MBT0770780.1 hypothetical protein [Kineosporia corallincola]